MLLPLSTFISLSSISVTGQENHVLPLQRSLGRFGVQLGDASYSIYLISLPVFYVYDRFYPHLAQLAPDGNVLLSLLTVAAMGLLCRHFLEKPLLHLLTAKYHHPAI